MIMILNMELLHLSTIEDHTTDMSFIIIVPIENRQFNELFPIFVFKNQDRFDRSKNGAGSRGK
ncbi:hypothetical protein ShirakiTA10_26480 [Bacillus safensis]|nr:hypothetical protein ShirakiTA10_26480 [Bacillus safensis]